MLVQKRKWTGNCRFVCFVPYLASASHSSVLLVAMKLLPTPLLEIFIKCDYQIKLKFLGPLVAFELQSSALPQLLTLCVLLKGCSNVLVA